MGDAEGQRHLHRVLDFRMAENGNTMNTKVVPT